MGQGEAGQLPVVALIHLQFSETVRRRISDCTTARWLYLAAVRLLLPRSRTEVWSGRKAGGCVRPALEQFTAGQPSHCAIASGLNILLFFAPVRILVECRVA